MLRLMNSSFANLRCLFVLFAATSATGALGRSIQEDEAPQVYRSATFLGRGDSGIAIADDEDSLFYNPAGLALFERPFGAAPKAGDFYKRAVLASPMVEGSEKIGRAHV